MARIPERENLKVEHDPDAPQAKGWFVEEITNEWPLYHTQEVYDEAALERIVSDDLEPGTRIITGGMTGPISGHIFEHDGRRWFRSGGMVGEVHRTKNGWCHGGVIFLDKLLNMQDIGLLPEEK